MHPTDGELLLSTEPSEQSNGSRVRAHLATCSPCTARLELLMVELEHVVGSLELPEGSIPAVDARAVIERARRRGAKEAGPRPSATVDRAPPMRPAPSPPESAPRVPSTSPPRSRRAFARAAAVAALLALAGAAAALPSSPVRRWLAQRSVARDAPPAPVQVAPAPDGFAGVALAADAPLEVVLPETVLGGTITLVSSTEEMVRVRASDPATGFSFGPGLLSLDTRAVALDLEVSSPPDLPRLVIRVGQRVVLERDQPFAPASLAPRDTLRISLGSR